ncbi:MAG: UDP-N-acetylglucosamine 1-carboxyvinyltransferase [Parachlamydiales bacterium]|nr:UDP-N-acetylglucosamine 1-carboxyvinyltransferase [Parachlamydiales bacterium]
MNQLKITGGVPLNGTIEAAGAKNAMTKLLVASLLSDKPCMFYNVPNIGDVAITVHLCEEIGAKIEWDRQNKTIKIHTPNILTTYISQKFSGANRIPILMLGALLSRTDQPITVPVVGGDMLGNRPLNFHMDAFNKLGATCQYDPTAHTYIAHARNGLKGTIIHLPYPSVGATENTMLCAISAIGTTIIKNAAIEPEIIDLILFLQKLGANITFDVDRTICIEGTRHFYPVEHRVLSDRNETVSYASLAIASQGKVFIKKAEHLHLIAFLNKLREIGAGFEIKSDGIEFFYKGPLKGGVHIETNVHPGFMTDWQPPFGVLLTQCHGASVIHETVYDNRFGYTKNLRQRGADIALFKECLGNKSCRFASLGHDHSVIIKGPTSFKGADIAIPDLRAGFAYVMAALLAPETSHISGADFLDRGYENFEEKLSSMGANIQRIP